MASPPPSSSFTLLVLLCILLSSLSSQSHHQHLKLPLTNTLSPSHFTSTHHLLKSTVTRSAARHHHLFRRSTTQVSLPLSPGGDYTLSFSLGDDPPQTLSVYMDTCSDLVWFPCSPFIYASSATANTRQVHPPRPSMYPHRVVFLAIPVPVLQHTAPLIPPPTFVPSRTILWPSSRCRTFPDSHVRHSIMRMGMAASSPGSTRNSLTMAPGSGQPLIMHNFTFGCAHYAVAEPVGVVGFGREPAQLANLSYELGNQFSYCLVTHSFDSIRLGQRSPLILGRANPGGPINNKVIYTPMLDNPKYPYFYTLGLEAVSVGGRRIPAPESLSRVDRHGNGGVVVDSGTTFTMLPSTLFNSVVSELDHRVGRFYKRASDIEEKTELSQ